MARRKLSVKEKRAREITRQIKQLEKKGYNAELATEGKSIKELSRSKKSYERFIKRKQVARERKKVEQEFEAIKQRFEESKKIQLKEIEEKRRIREEELKRREEEKRRREQEKEKIPLKDLGHRAEGFGMDIDEEFKLKEFLTNMLSERMEDVPRDLVEKVKDIIYKADIHTLDRISDFFPSWDAFKEFYTYNDDDVYGSNTRAEKIEVLEELIRFVGE